MEKSASQSHEFDRSISMHDNPMPMKKGKKGKGKAKAKAKGSKRQWTKKEGAVLVECLLELKEQPLWRTERGFKCGYLAKVEKMMWKKLPHWGLKAQPHID
ncbi:hypothetical protein Patl1_10030 [Pistacia atlantica]|uniref:Uncharacterized protein n=1 Tax=Pistacia atlantica TaxID=434234 RepID=A0ACC1A6F2_9ROSI|nr:hypothetical protein Patl1_10030 [Pistacia atlantica]